MEGNLISSWLSRRWNAHWGLHRDRLTNMSTLVAVKSQLVSIKNISTSNRWQRLTIVISPLRIVRSEEFRRRGFIIVL